MKARRKDSTGEEGQGTRHPKPRRPLAAHPLFAPLLGAWGAALGGLVTLALPETTATAAAQAAGLGMFGALARLALAGLAAAVLGAVLYACARAASRKANRRADTPSLAALAMRHVRPIDPASELGSRRFDDPVAAEPFAATPHPEVPADAPVTDAAPPRALDLAAFAELPGRNAVWVEEPAQPSPALAASSPAEPEPEPEPAPAPQPLERSKPRPAPVPRPVQDRALAQLRAVPPSELSLIQMVERFAAALHERKAQAPDAAERRPADDDRDAMLAEALKALAELSGGSQDEAGGEPLRDAVARLQELRGAA